MRAVRFNRAWKAVQRALGERKDRAVDQYRRERLGLLNEIQSARVGGGHGR